MAHAGARGGGGGGDVNQAILFPQQVTFLQNITQTEHKITILNGAFCMVRGFTASPYILCDCGTGGQKGSKECRCNVYIYIQCTYISIKYSYLFIMH